jgi:putative transposase
MDASLTSQLKELQDENRRLKKMYTGTQFSADLLKETTSKKVKPSQHREMAKGCWIAGEEKAQIDD